MIEGEDCGAISGINEWQGKPKYSEKTWPSAALSTIDVTWFNLGSNLSRRGWKMATNRLSYCTAVAN
jgi:hypothetical protein